MSDFSESRRIDLSQQPAMQSDDSERFSTMPSLSFLYVGTPS